LRKVDRLSTARSASTRLENLLSRKEYSAALLLAFIYVDMRLTTLLTDVLCSSEDNWEEIADIVEYLGFRRKVERCKKRGLLSALRFSEKKLDSELEKLREKRNDAAHETRIWKGLDAHEIQAVKRRCQFAQEFLEMTAG